MQFPSSKTFRVLICLAFTGLLASCASLDAETTVTQADIPPAKPLQLIPEEPANTAKTEPEVAELPVDLPMAAEPEPDDLWVRLRQGFRLNHEIDRKRVQAELNWYLKHPDYVERVTRRAMPHLYYIIGELEERGLPLEFALLPIVESAYDPFAYSHGRAAGLWQFIPSTARLYGLKIDWWYDGRRDVRASTQAAISYLEHLNGMFLGDWLLALAAYNAGEGNVLSSIRKSGQTKQNADFWTLKVFRETYTYVPRLLAISELIANPEQYGISLPDIPNAPYWQAVPIHAQLDLHKAAELAAISVEDVYKLNPGFNQWATHPDGPHELIVPIDKADDFNEALSSLDPAQRVAWKRHKVKWGENLGTIARKYRTTIDTIRTANNISGNMIRDGQSLLIPAASEGVHYAMSKSGRLKSKQANLEQRYGSEPIEYVVQPGDSFWEISRRFGVGMRQLAKWNGMGTTGLLHPGTTLKIFKKSATVTAAQPPKVNQIRKLNYRVRKGESLALIASKFNVTVQKIKSWNQALAMQKYIHPGDRLTLYVDVTSLVN